MNKIDKASSRQGTWIRGLRESFAAFQDWGLFQFRVQWFEERNNSFFRKISWFDYDGSEFSILNHQLKLDRPIKTILFFMKSSGIKKKIKKTYKSYHYRVLKVNLWTVSTLWIIQGRVTRLIQNSNDLAIRGAYSDRKIMRGQQPLRLELPATDKTNENRILQ